MTAKRPPPVLPNLRFSEFHRNAGWKRTLLSNVLTFQNGYPFPSAHFGEGKKGIRLIRNRDLRSDERVVYYDGPPQPDFFINDHDVLVGMDGDFTPCVWRKGPGILNQRVARILPRNGHVLTFLRYLLEIELGAIEDTTASTTVKHLSSKQVERMTVWIPDPDEQQKIADCLSSLDDLIAAEGQKLESLRQHKQGLMQQLFPEPPAALPRLRFPAFHDNGEWKEQTAGKLFLNRLSKGEEGLPIYSVTMHGGMVRRDSLERNYYDIEEATGNKKAHKNDIAYNMMRMWQGALGVAPEDCLVSPAYIVLAPQKHVVPKFFEYLFKLPASMLLLTSYSRGLTSDRLRLYYDDFSRIPLRCPSEPEQQRIADCLSALDTSIAGQVRKLDALRSHKRGLLQQVFPSRERAR